MQNENDALIEKTPLHLQVYRIAKSRIVSGQWSLGQRVVESKLVKELGISNSPVREGLRMLEQEAFLRSTPVGLIVNPMDYEDIVQAHECRIGLEPYAARLAAQKATAAEIKLMQAHIDAAQQCLPDKNYKSVVEHNSSFHALIIGCCRNKHIQSVLEAINALIILSRMAQSPTEYLRIDYHSQHQAILNALAARDDNETERIVRLHVERDFIHYKHYKEADQ